MNRIDARKIAENITNEQILNMFKSAMGKIKDWEKTSSVNKGLSKGTAWNILASDFDVNHKYHNMAKINMIREFGEFLPDNLKIVKNKVDRNNTKPTHQEPKFGSQYKKL